MFTPVAGVTSYDSLVATSSNLPTQPRPSVNFMTTTTARRKAIWQPDYTAQECPTCMRRFSTFVRKHHCRVCGRVICYQCSLSRVALSQDVCVNTPDGLGSTSAPSMYHRVCDECMRTGDVATIAAAAAAATPVSFLSSPIDTASTTITKSIKHKAVLEADDGANLSECPVCLQPLASFESDREREEHVNMCLMGVGSSPAGFSVNGRYLVYTLKENSALVGMECVICFEEFAAGERIARLECLCNYHRVRTSDMLFHFHD